MRFIYYFIFVFSASAIANAGLAESIKWSSIKKTFSRAMCSLPPNFEYSFHPGAEKAVLDAVNNEIKGLTSFNKVLYIGARSESNGGVVYYRIHMFSGYPRDDSYPDDYFGTERVFYSYQHEWSLPALKRSIPPSTRSTTTGTRSGAATSTPVHQGAEVEGDLRRGDCTVEQLFTLYTLDGADIESEIKEVIIIEPQQLNRRVIKNTLVLKFKRSLSKGVCLLEHANVDDLEITDEVRETFTAAVQEIHLRSFRYISDTFTWYAIEFRSSISEARILYDRDSRFTVSPIVEQFPETMVLSLLPKRVEPPGIFERIRSATRRSTVGVHDSSSNGASTVGDHNSVISIGIDTYTRIVTFTMGSLDHNSRSYQSSVAVPFYIISMPKGAVFEYPIVSSLIKHELYLIDFVDKKVYDLHTKHHDSNQSCHKKTFILQPTATKLGVNHHVLKLANDLWTTGSDRVLKGGWQSRFSRFVIFDSVSYYSLSSPVFPLSLDDTIDIRKRITWELATRGNDAEHSFEAQECSFAQKYRHTNVFSIDSIDL